MVIYKTSKSLENVVLGQHFDTQYSPMAPCPGRGDAARCQVVSLNTSPAGSSAGPGCRVIL